MKVDQISPQVKRRQGHYLPKKQDQKHQLKIDDLLLKKKKRSNENELIGTCPKKAKMMLNPFNKFNSYYLFNSSVEHCSSTKLHQTAKITNQTNLQNNQNKINHINENASLLFNRKTGLPLSSSPIPQHKSTFNFERAIKSTNAIKRAIFNKEPDTDENFNLLLKKSTRTPLFKNLLGNFEENLLNGRFDAAKTIHGQFRVEIGTYGKLYNNFFCPDHLKMPVTVYFYNIQELGNIYASPYLAKVNLEKKGYLVPRKGNVQVTLFNPENNIVKMFVVQYDLSEMPSNSQSFIRQKIYYMPNVAESTTDRGSKTNCQSDLNSDSNENQSSNIGTSLSLSTANLTSNLPTNLTATSDRKLCKFESSKLDFKTSWLRYLIHLRFISTKSGKIYLHRDIRILISRKNEFDPGSLIGKPTFRWVTEQITEQANNSPKYSLR